MSLKSIVRGFEYYFYGQKVRKPKPVQKKIKLEKPKVVEEFPEQTCYANRELSWLKFNERVLEEADDIKIPLCERLFFISIFQSNLDEFFMIRVGSLQDQMLLKEKVRENKTNMTSSEQLKKIMLETEKLCKKRDVAYLKIMEEIKHQGVRLLLFYELSKEQKKYVENYFVNEILPLLSPMIVGEKQPFPFMKNKEIYAVVVLETIRGKEKIGIIPCTANKSERMIPIPSIPGGFILMEELILHFVPMIFVQYNIRGKSLVKITRNADIDDESIRDEDLNYRDMLAQIIKMRKKLSPVRLELTRELDIKVVQVLCMNLKINKSQVFISNVPLDTGFINQIRDLLREKQELFYDRYVPCWPLDINKDEPMIKNIQKKDILLSYPYESIKPFLLLLQEAANDNEVVSIKMTLYRLAKNSKIVDSLIEAAENGKEVVVLVELKARFDEENNIEWSRRLEAAGCIIIFGIDGVKVHSKICLITRKYDKKIEYITQLGTGNYNENTATLYTDYSILTANETIGKEAAAVFNSLLMGEIPKPTKNLLVAPKGLQNKLVELIDKESDFIGLKINSLTDIVLINKLIEASQRGVNIKLIVRGICCLIPGIKDKTENIEVVSIVGRFLEHSRVYIFGNEKNEKIYISSADWMTRNTLRRIEIAAPIYDETLKEKIMKAFNIMLKDNVKSRRLNEKGFYTRVVNEDEELNSQKYFCESNF